jgi:hypothetical protein
MSDPTFNPANSQLLHDMLAGRRLAAERNMEDCEDKNIKRIWHRAAMAYGRALQAARDGDDDECKAESRIAIEVEDLAFAAERGDDNAD